MYLCMYVWGMVGYLEVQDWVLLLLYYDYYVMIIIILLLYYYDDYGSYVQQLIWQFPVAMFLLRTKCSGYRT